ncbi:hypothetical protein OPV22_017766 [Ensete ventricosum]|uniref:Uncharacterized protein n=1 Tax=Ensete ventricosum TaxID=4639 RepID=A0AAV8QTX6_ENSVE|nr:hypothetical protein OPV22_017766 [Ensete ventricosum]
MSANRASPVSDDTERQAVEELNGLINVARDAFIDPIKYKRDPITTANLNVSLPPSSTHTALIMNTIQFCLT